MSNPREIKAVKGRLSFHDLTAQEAFENAQRGPFAASTPTVADAKPYITLLLTEGSYEKMLKHIVEEFFPMCAEVYKNEGDKGKNALSPKEIAALTAQLEEGEGPYNTPFKLPSDKTLELMPEAVRSLKVIGPKGGNFAVAAYVRGEDELSAPDPDRVKYPVILPINQTQHDLYSGCWAGTSGTLYSYRNGKNPGFSFGGDTVVFMADDARFGGGGAIDEQAFIDMFDD